MSVLPANTIWRDKVVDGVYSSANHDPVKAEIREYMTWVESGISAGTLSGPWEATKAALDVKLDYVDGNPGFVYDGVDFGTYRKSGASGAGSWVKILDTIPGYQVVKATNSGAGTANAIVATSTPPVSYSDGKQIISVDITANNTSEDVTVNFDGLGDLAIKTAANNKPAVDGLVAPVRIWGQVDAAGTVFRMMSDQASAAVQAAAEAAQTAAENALASLGAVITGDLVVKTDNYTILDGDIGDTVVMNAATAKAFTLPDVATVGTPWQVRVYNMGVGTLTVQRAGSDTVNGGTSVDLDQYQGAVFMSDGTSAWLTDAMSALIPDNSIEEPKLADTLSSTLVYTVAGVAALKALDTSRYTEVRAREAGLYGSFVRDNSDLSATMVLDSLTSTAVDDVTDTITVAAHGLVTTDVVVPTTTVSGVTAGTKYFVIRDDVNNFQLAVTLADARAGTPVIDLTGTTNFTVKHLLDPYEGVYVISTGDAADGSDGAWVRQFDDDVHAVWFGLAEAGSPAANTASINAAINVAHVLGCGVALPGYEFDSDASAGGGIVVKENTHLYGQGKRKTIINLDGGGTAVQLRNYQAGSGIRREFYLDGLTKARVKDVLIERLAVVMNHPLASITTTEIQIGIDYRNISRSMVRDCWIGNYHPITDTKGGTAPYLVQGWAWVAGNESGGADYAGGEVNTFEDNFVAGAWRCVAIDDNILTPTSAAYRQRVVNNDIQIGQILVLQASQYGAGSTFRDNVLQSTVAKNGDASGNDVFNIAGFGNIIEESYIEGGATCRYILRFGGSADHNRAKFSGTVSATGGGGAAAFSDAGGGSSYNVIEFYADTGTHGANSHDSKGSPQRMISGTSTTQT